MKLKKISNIDPSWGPQEFPTRHCNFLSSDGYYYNGYMNSPECAEWAFGDCMREISKKIEWELKYWYDHGNGD